MHEGDILALKPKTLSQEQRKFYFDNGYLLLEKIISDDWIDRLRAVTDERVDQTRATRQSDENWIWSRDTVCRRPVCAVCPVQPITMKNIGPNTNRPGY